MLNSAAGVQLPCASPPPMSEIRAMRAFSSGCAVKSAATFVSGPVATSVIGSSHARIVSAMRSTDDSGESACPGSGSGGPSSPESP